MSLFEEILTSIGKKGQHLSGILGKDTANISNSVKNSPFDGEKHISQEAWELSQAIVTDCYQLISILTPGRMQILKLAFSASLETAIGIAAHFNVADAIESCGGKASIDEIAATVNTDATKLGNVLQTLTSRHVFEEIEPNVFTNNRHSLTLMSGSGCPEMIESYALVSGKAFDSLLPLMTDQNDMHTIDPRRGAFSRAYGVPMGITEWIIQPGNEAYLNQLMAGLPWLTETAAFGVVNEFDWGKSDSPTRICDMGSADGGIMAHVKSKLPASHIICQDLVPVLPVIRQTMERFHPKSMARGEIEIVEHDYFTPQATKADIYWLRGVLHDYTDSQAVDILKSLSPQLRLNPQARVLINEIVKPRLLVDSKSTNHLASEMVPKNQSGFLEMSSLMQLHTTAFLAGLERSFEDFINLFERAGYRLIRFHKLPLYSCIMEIGLGQS